MTQPDTDQQPPRGFSERTRSLPAEYAHEQGWQLNEDERRKQSSQPDDTDGGADYNYGAQDFGDSPINTAIDRTAATLTQNRPQSATHTEKETHASRT